MSTLESIVVGAGIVGVSSAIRLKRAGHDVTLIDTGAPGMGATYGSGLRCAGAVEFGEPEAGPSDLPINLSLRKVREIFPNMTADNEEEWLGFRPSPTDSLPLIGEVRNSGVYAAFGHHHIGLTGGPKTGRMVADLIAGRHPNNNMSPYDPNRFAKRA